MRRPKLDSLLGEALRTSILLIAYPIFCILIIVLIASYIPIPIAYAYLLLVLIAGIGALFLGRRTIPKEGLKINKTEEWVAVATLAGLAFVLGQTLLALSSFYSPPTTQSRCVDPSNVTVTSLVCRAIQTTTLAQSSGYGSYGALISLVAVVWTLVFVVISGLYYTMYSESRIEHRSWYVPE